MTLRVIDIETTGKEAGKDAIVEIASVDLQADGTIANAMQTFVNPLRSIPPAMSGIHHIVDVDVAGAPTLAEAIERFRGADAYVAHNAKFEASFLEANGITLSWVCTYKCALRVWPNAESHKNQSLRYMLGLVEPFGIPRHEIHAHRAASDVIVTAGILQVLLASARWSELRAWSDEPALFTRFTWGMHDGRRFSEVPADYLSWMLRQPDMEEDKKFSATRELERRRQPAQKAEAA